MQPLLINQINNTISVFQLKINHSKYFNVYISNQQKNAFTNLHKIYSKTIWIQIFDFIIVICCTCVYPLNSSKITIYKYYTNLKRLRRNIYLQNGMAFRRWMRRCSAQQRMQLINIICHKYIILLYLYMTQKSFLCSLYWPASILAWSHSLCSFVLMVIIYIGESKWPWVIQSD